MFPSNWYQHRWEPDYKVFQSYDPTIFVHRNNCSNFISKPYCQLELLLPGDLCTKGEPQCQGCGRLALLQLSSPLLFSEEAWLPFSGFRPLFYGFGILSPFFILGVFSSPLLFLEDKDFLPFFIGLKKFLLLQRGTRDMQKVVFRAASGGCQDPQYERRGSEEAHRPWMFGHFNPNLAIWPIEPPASSPSQPLSPEFCNSKQNLTPQSCLACIMVDHYPIWGTGRQNKSGNKVTLPLCPNFQGWQKIDLKNCNVFRVSEYDNKTLKTHISLIYSGILD